MPESGTPTANPSGIKIVDAETVERQLKHFHIDFSQASSRKDVLFLLSQSMKPLPMVASAYAWEDFAKKLEHMADEGSPRVPKFRQLVLELYGSYLRGVAYWLKHDMAGAVIDTTQQVPLPCSPECQTPEKDTGKSYRRRGRISARG